MSIIEDNIKVDIKEMGWKFVKCIRLPQDKNQWLILLKRVMKFGVPIKLGGGGIFSI
jgi:hypothetical protein